jgi:hypothetical protein
MVRLRWRGGGGGGDWGLDGKIVGVDFLHLCWNG